MLWHGLGVSTRDRDTFMLAYGGREGGRTIVNEATAILERITMSEIQKHALIEMLQYQEGAVVSKTLIDKKTGSVTLFAFGQGQGLSEHAAPFDALVHVLDGEVEIRISDQPFHLFAGDFIVMPANEPHALKAVKSFKMLLTMIRS